MITILDTLEIGDPVFGVLGEKQAITYGFFAGRRSAYAVIEWPLAGGVVRRRLIHGRFVWRVYAIP